MSPLECIQNAKNVELALSENPHEKSLGDALCLLAALTQSGKQVALSPGFLKLAHADWIHPFALPLETATISLKGIAPYISKVSYEKSNQDIKLSFSLSQGTIKPEHVHIEQRPSPDLTIIVGANPRIHNQDMTVNPHPRLWNTNLALECSLSLLSPFQIPSLKLLSRSLSTLEHLKDRKTCFVSFERRDFRETQTNPRDIKSVASHLAAFAKPEISLFAIFETGPGNNIQGILKSDNPALRKKFQGKEKGSWALFDLPMHNLSAAREHITSLL